MSKQPHSRGKLRRLQRKRGRRAAECLLEDPRLRDNLDDECAKPLLDWGIKHTDTAVRRTINLPEKDAQAVIDERVQAVRLVLMHLNQLCPQLAHTQPDGVPTMNQDEAKSELETLERELAQLQKTSSHSLSHINELLLHRLEMSSSEVCQHLMAIFFSDEASNDDFMSISGVY